MAAGCHRQSWAKGRLRCTDLQASLSEPQFPPLTQEEDDRVPEETFGEWTRSGLRAAGCLGAGEAAGVGSGGLTGRLPGPAGGATTESRGPRPRTLTSPHSRGGSSRRPAAAAAVTGEPGG